jgi:hypothetical protein
MIKVRLISTIQAFATNLRHTLVHEDDHESCTSTSHQGYEYEEYGGPTRLWKDNRTLQKPHTVEAFVSGHNGIFDGQEMVGRTALSLPCGTAEKGYTSMRPLTE